MPEGLEIVYDTQHCVVWLVDMDVELRKDRKRFAEQIRNDFENHFVKRERVRRMQFRSHLETLILPELRSKSSPVEFLRTKLGKPYLKGNPIQFSVSRSGQFGLIAISKYNPVGVDIEVFQPDYDMAPQLSNCFSEGERSYLAEFDGAEKLREFFWVWTRKEALLKCLGVGLSVELSSFDVLSDLVVLDENPTVQLHRLELPEGLVGSVALL